MSSPLQPESEKEQLDKLEDMIDPFVSDGSGAVDTEGFFKKLIPYIQANYISKAAVKEAIGETEPHYDSDNAQETGYKLGQDDLRDDLKTKLEIE